MNDFRDFREEARQRWETRRERSGHGHVWTGLFLLLIGGLALVKSFGVPMPVWLFSWQMLLIAIGLFIGLRKGFRDGGWFVPIIVGGIFLVNEYLMDGSLRRHMWPLILIALGVIFLIRPKRSRAWQSCQKKSPYMNAETVTPVSEAFHSSDDLIDSTCIFSGSKKVILSKNFKGGDIVNVFGGSEIDFMQADINGTAVLEVTAIFGGATLIVPSNWAIKSEAVTIFGGISDKRKFAALSEPSNNKTLVLKGTMIFGGMEIKSY
jgi:predicted membrane protein